MHCPLRPGKRCGDLRGRVLAQQPRDLAGLRVRRRPPPVHEAELERGGRRAELHAPVRRSEQLLFLESDAGGGGALFRHVADHLRVRALCVGGRGDFGGDALTVVARVAYGTMGLPFRLFFFLQAFKEIA